jgi:hypothetical protein
MTTPVTASVAKAMPGSLDIPGFLVISKSLFCSCCMQGHVLQQTRQLDSTRPARAARFHISRRCTNQGRRATRVVESGG